MGGFTKDAIREVHSCENPTMIPLEREDITQLVYSDNIEEEFREKINII